MNAQQKAAKLNAHHIKTCAGFYAVNGGRYFEARSYVNRLDVRTWGGEWIDATDWNFRDHNGRLINLD